MTPESYTTGDSGSAGVPYAIGNTSNPGQPYITKQALIDDFERGNLDPYLISDYPEHFETVTNPVFAGDYALKIRNSESFGGEEFLVSNPDRDGPTLPGYPVEGDSFKFHINDANFTNLTADFFFGQQTNESSITTFDDLEGYYVGVDFNDDEVRVADIGGTRSVDAAGIDISDQWLRVETEWRSDAIAVELFREGQTTPVASEEQSNFGSVTAGGVAWRVSSFTGATGEVYADEIRFI